MTLSEFYNRTRIPEPWAEGDNIPWHDPAFSRRMLREHLSQDHDRASRRFDIIDSHVQWIHQSLLGGRPSRILDLGCGPGLYAHRLGALGHTVTGIDYSPAAIEFARNPHPDGFPEFSPAYLDSMAGTSSRCTFHCSDLRHVADYRFGSDPYDLIMLLYGEFNVFRPAHIRQILDVCCQALAPGGILLLEPQTHDAVRRTGLQSPFWSQAAASVFSDRPHIWLEEYAWDPPTETATTRYWVIDAATADVTPYAQTFQAWSAEALDALLTARGLMDARLYPCLAGAEDEAAGDLMVIVLGYKP